MHSNVSHISGLSTLFSLALAPLSPYMICVLFSIETSHLQHLPSEIPFLYDIVCLHPPFISIQISAENLFSPLPLCPPSSPLTQFIWLIVFWNSVLEHFALLLLQFIFIHSIKIYLATALGTFEKGWKHSPSMSTNPAAWFYGHYWSLASQKYPILPTNTTTHCIIQHCWKVSRFRKGEVSSKV